MLDVDMADSYFSFYMVKELNDIGKLKMKVLKMMLMSIDIQIRKTCFYRKEMSSYLRQTLYIFTANKFRRS